jgi:hypothetical protein
MHLKELNSLVPPFSSPARIWAKKICLLWPDHATSPPHLLDIIKLRLPPNLFDAVSDCKLASHIALLEKICTIEGPTVQQAAQYLLESKATIHHNQTPREL